MEKSREKKKRPIITQLPAYIILYYVLALPDKALPKYKNDRIRDFVTGSETICVYYIIPIQLQQIGSSSGSPQQYSLHGRKTIQGDDILYICT